MSVPEILARGFEQRITVDGVVITDALAARESFNLGGTKYATATFASIAEHGDFLSTVQIDQGVTELFVNGVPSTPLGLIGRFTGQRSGAADFTLFPRAVLHHCAGELWKAERYVNFEDPGGFGGLRLDDLVGHPPPVTPSELRQAVLTKCGVTFSPANIGGSAAQYGGMMLTPELVMLWPAGTPTSATEKWVRQTRGMTGMDYLGQIDKVDAEVGRDLTGAPVSGGFYVLFESLSGAVYCILVGGRPRGAWDHVFVEEGDGANILEGSTVSREPPVANRVFVEGYDYGKGGGPVWSEELGASVFFPTPITLADSPSSPWIEKAEPEDAGPGMDCHTVAAAVYLETLRFTPHTHILTPDDAELGIGQTHVVAGTAHPDGTGALPGRLKTGEPVWCRSLDITLDLLENGAPSWVQALEHAGGGQPDATLPAPGL